jgi:hypothetical protein
MRHEIAREKLLDLAYGELPAAEAAEVEAHLQGCAACRAEADGIEATRRAMRALPPEEPPPGEGILLAAARQVADRARPGRASLLFWLRPALGAAVVVAVVGVSWKLIGPGVQRAVDVETSYRSAAPLPATPTPTPTSTSTGTGDATPDAAPPPEAKAAPSLVRRKAASEPVLLARDPVTEEKAVKLEEAVADQVAAAVAKERPGAVRAVPAPAAAPPAAPRQLPAAGIAPAAAQLAAEPAALPGPLAEAEELVRDLRRQRDEGKLNEARRRPEPCPGGDLERVAWLDGWGKARRLARTGPLPAGMGEGEVTRDQYYDADGRLRLVHIQGTGPEGRFARRIVLDAGGRRLLEDPPGKGPWPAPDLVLADPAAAFWAPQRCGK